jgi:hypothetical protein
LGDRLVDRYLEFVAGRCRPNTLRAVAFDLKAFFAVTGKDPVEVTAADVFEFLAQSGGSDGGAAGGPGVGAGGFAGAGDPDHPLAAGHPGPSRDDRRGPRLARGAR